MLHSRILAPEGCLLEHLPEGGARSGVPRHTAGNRSPREVRHPAFRALRPGCEELAVSDPDASPVREARRPTQNRHGGAPRGERPALWDARRLTSAWRAASRHAPRVLSTAPVRLSVLRPPLIPGERGKRQTPGAKNAPRERKGVVR